MNILIADDNEGSRIIMSTLLEEKGHNVVDAPNGKIALNMIKKTVPDMVITCPA